MPSSPGVCVLGFGANPSCVVTVSYGSKARLCQPPGRCHGGSAALCGMAGGASRHQGYRALAPGLQLSRISQEAASPAASARLALLAAPGTGVAQRRGESCPGQRRAGVPRVGCGWSAGPAELIPIVSCSAIVIPDHKELGGSQGAELPPDTRQASLGSLCLS